MANPSFIMQGIKRGNDHETAITALLRLRDIEQVIFSVAFARKNGVDRLAKVLRELAKRTVIFVGIRNGVTSAQALTSLFETGAKVFAVDTGSLSTLFHPKIYLAYNNENARAIIGSANLTYAGLNENVEASTLLNLNRADQTDESYLTDLIETVTSLPANHPRHVFLLRSATEIAKLLHQGRLEDERIEVPPRVSQIKKGSKRDKLPQIKLYKRPKPKPVLQPAKPAKSSVSKNWKLIWVSKGLTERDLNIPTGESTHPTGSMLFKKGQMDAIDQRHYFRDIVFKKLHWEHDPSPKLRHIERTEADFEIIVKGISFGAFELKLSHNTRTDTKAYEQRNAMTQIHWGKAKTIIAQRDLLGREFKLYRRTAPNIAFVIEID